MNTERNYCIYLTIKQEEGKQTILDITLMNNNNNEIVNRIFELPADVTIGEVLDDFLMKYTDL